MTDAEKKSASIRLAQGDARVREKDREIESEREREREKERETDDDGREKGTDEGEKKPSVRSRGPSRRSYHVSRARSAFPSRARLLKPVEQRAAKFADRSA